jgi:hypothetical protein
MKKLLFYPVAAFFTLKRLVSLCVSPHSNGLNLLQDLSEPTKLTVPLKAKGASA